MIRQMDDWKNVYSRIKREHLGMPFVSYKLADSFVQEMDDGAAIRDEVSSFLP